MINAIEKIITQGELRALAQRAEQAERERDEARAQAAALRDALEELYGLWLIAKPLIECGDDPYLVPFMELHQPLAVIGAALKDDAGAAILAVVTAARRLDDCIVEFGDDAPKSCGEYFQALSDALASLDGWRC